MYSAALRTGSQPGVEPAVMLGPRCGLSGEPGRAVIALQVIENQIVERSAVRKTLKKINVFHRNVVSKTTPYAKLLRSPCKKHIHTRRKKNQRKNMIQCGMVIGKNEDCAPRGGE